MTADLTQPLKQPWPVAREDVPDGELHWSELWVMSDSALACREAARTPRDSTDATDFGSLAHYALLEPERLDACLLVEPDFGNLRTKAGRAARAEWYAEVAPDAPPVLTTEDTRIAKRYLPPGVMIVSEADKQRVFNCVWAVWEHKSANELIEQAVATEIDLTWERYGVRCGGRIDLLLEDAIVDLKTTRFSALGPLKRDLARRGVHGQLAWYDDGAKRADRIPTFGSRLPYTIAVQSEPPHDVAVLQLDEETYRAGEALANDLLTQWVGCVETGWWPGMAPEVVTWHLPPWAPGMEQLADEHDDDDEEPW